VLFHAISHLRDVKGRCLVSGSCLKYFFLREVHAPWDRLPKRCPRKEASITPAARRRRTRPRLEIERALIDSAARLLEQQGPRSVTVKAIAEQAGVNHGYVHHYFGSKEALVGRVLDELAVEVTRDLSEGVVFDGTSSGARYVRVACRAALDGYDPGFIDRDFPVRRMLEEIGRERFGLDDSSVQLRAVQVLALAMGWLLFEPFLVRAGSLSESELNSLRWELEAAMLHLVRPRLTPEELEAVHEQVRSALVSVPLPEGRSHPSREPEAPGAASPPRRR
jgi:AcrR family transcriptional regulator